MFGIASKYTQACLLESKELDFEKEVQIATSMELPERDATEIQVGTASAEC